VVEAALTTRVVVVLAACSPVRLLWRLDPNS
jgi:hypothetical protein